MRFLHSEEAASAVEYSLVAGLIAAVIVLGVAAFGEDVLALFTYSANELQKVDG